MNARGPGATPPGSAPSTYFAKQMVYSGVRTEDALDSRRNRIQGVLLWDGSAFKRAPGTLLEPYFLQPGALRLFRLLYRQARFRGTLVPGLSDVSQFPLPAERSQRQ
jgi:hypothetical protein